MKIAVNCRLLISNKLSGMGWFAYHTLKRIVQNNPQHQFIFLFDRKFDNQFIFGSNVIPEIIFPPTRHPILQYYWFEHAIIKVIKKHNPDVFYTPDGFSSLRLKDIPTLAVIHDINFHHNPKDLPFADRIYFRYFFPKFARSATRLLTVSEYSKADISKTYEIAEDKIDVTCNGSNEIFIPLTEEQKINTRTANSNGEEYFIYVGDLIPRKNISRLIAAFDQFKIDSRSKTKLLIVGGRMCLTSEMDAAYKSAINKNDIIFTGKVSIDILKYLLGSAKALALVSSFEGFGIPIIEAMNADIPVITSNTTSMPEIAGDAALLVDPNSISSIANAMNEIDNKEGLRNKLIEKGRIQKVKYTWDKAADIIWKSIEKTIDIRK